jgi:ABC-type glycerol-3-phosphate transport system permease component
MPRTTITWTSDASDVLSFAPTRPKGADLLSGEIPSSRRSDPGAYQLIVTLEEGWNEATGNETACVILSETVTIASTQTQLVVAVVLSVIFVLVVAALAYVLYRNRQRFKAVLFSLLSLELMLTLEILSVRLVVCRTIWRRGCRQLRLCALQSYGGACCYLLLA